MWVWLLLPLLLIGQSEEHKREVQKADDIQIIKEELQRLNSIVSNNYTKTSTTKISNKSCEDLIEDIRQTICKMTFNTKQKAKDELIRRNLPVVFSSVKDKQVLQEIFDCLNSLIKESET